MATLQKPEPAFQQHFSSSEEQLRSQDISTDNSLDLKREQGQDYDPCQNAQKFSPFYMYNHDSPRPSTDQRPKQVIQMDVRDLELGGITPSVSQEKINAQRQDENKFTKFKFWNRRQKCMTRPKKQTWLQRLPKKQRIMVKLLIALVIAGAMVGIAVGIAAALHSGVYGSDKTVGQKDA